MVIGNYSIFYIFRHSERSYQAKELDGKKLGERKEDREMQREEKGEHLACWQLCILITMISYFDVANENDEISHNLDRLQCDEITPLAWL